MPTFREHYTEDGFAKNVAIVSDNGSYLVTIVCIKQVGGDTIAKLCEEWSRAFEGL